MKKIILFNLIFLLPILVSAQATNNAAGGLIGCKQDPCTLADLIGLIGRWINFAIKDLIIPLAVLAFLYAGFLMVAYSAESSQRNKAKSIIYDAVWGIVVALGAYLLVQAITQGLGGKNPEQYLNNVPQTQNLSN